MGIARVTLQMVRSHVGYTQDLGLVHQAAQAGSARSERPSLPRRIPKLSAKLGQNVRQRAGDKEVDSDPYSNNFKIVVSF